MAEQSVRITATVRHQSSNALSDRVMSDKYWPNRISPSFFYQIRVFFETFALPVRRAERYHPVSPMQADKSGMRSDRLFQVQKPASKMTRVPVKGLSSGRQTRGYTRHSAAL